MDGDGARARTSPRHLAGTDWLTHERRGQLEREIRDLVSEKAVEVVPRDTYVALRETALRRVPRDERDWPTVAAAMALGAPILTADNDFPGCGCPTWAVETLAAEVASA